MARLIELQADQELPETLAVAPGDVILFEASGAWPPAEGGAVELIGIFTRSLVGEGRVLAPMGAPNVVLMRACRVGSARVELALGDPWGSPTRAALRVEVAE